MTEQSPTNNISFSAVVLGLGLLGLAFPRVTPLVVALGAMLVADQVRISAEDLSNRGDPGGEESP